MDVNKGQAKPCVLFVKRVSSVKQLGQPAKQRLARDLQLHPGPRRANAGWASYPNDRWVAGFRVMSKRSGGSVSVSSRIRPGLPAVAHEFRPEGVGVAS
jgi:hypothetical protein